MTPLSDDDKAYLRKQFDKEGNHSVKSQIVQIALDKFNHQCWPSNTVRRNVGAARYGIARAFRVPDDDQPLGFEFHGVSIEVHVTGHKNILIPKTTLFYHIPVLLILGIQRDGLIKVIAKGVLAQ